MTLVTDPLNYLSFTGGDLPTGKGRPTHFHAMCGDEPPTITSGYSTWSPVKRPLMQDVSVFTGYLLAEMTVNVRFGYWTPEWQTDTNPKPGVDVNYWGRKTEDDIKALELMAGTAARYYSGPPQVVHVTGYGDSKTFHSPLIPQQYYHNPYTGKLMDWYVSAPPAWGLSYRNSNGYRILQECTIVLSQYNGYGPPPNVSTPPTQGEPGGWFTATSRYDTAAKIANAPSAISNDPAALAKLIIHSPKNKKLNLNSVNRRIKPHKKVWVPGHVA